MDTPDAHITEYLYEITPIHGKRGDRYGLEYDSVRWESIDESEQLEGDELVTYGRYGQAEMDTTGFTALRTFINVPTNHNVLYVTDDSVYVFEHEVAGRGDDRYGVREGDFETAAATALCELSLSEKIDGLRPADDRPVPTESLHEEPDLNDAIESVFVNYDPGERRTERVIYVVPESDSPDREMLTDDLCTFYGVSYSQPGQIVFVDDESAFPSRKDSSDGH